MSKQYMTRNVSREYVKYMGWRGGENHMYCTTLYTTGKKLKVGIRSMGRMMSTVSIPFYFHQSLTHMFLFMLLRTNHSTSLRSRMVFIPKLKQFQILFSIQRQKQKLE